MTFLFFGFQCYQKGEKRSSNDKVEVNNDPLNSEIYYLVNGFFNL